jgi:hypothetical protein
MRSPDETTLGTDWKADSDAVVILEYSEAQTAPDSWSWHIIQLSSRSLDKTGKTTVPKFDPVPVPAVGKK